MLYKRLMRFFFSLARSYKCEKAPERMVTISLSLMLTLAHTMSTISTLSYACLRLGCEPAVGNVSDAPRDHHGKKKAQCQDGWNLSLATHTFPVFSRTTHQTLFFLFLIYHHYHHIFFFFLFFSFLAIYFTSRTWNRKYIYIYITIFSFRYSLNLGPRTTNRHAWSAHRSCCCRGACRSRSSDRGERENLIDYQVMCVCVPCLLCKRKYIYIDW